VNYMERQERLRTAREQDRLLVAERLKAEAKEVVGGVWDGRVVIPYERLLDALDAPMEAASEYASELRIDRESGGRIVIWADCPNCGITQPLSAELHPQLVVGGGYAELKVKAKSKARTHTCGQEPLPLSDEAVKEMREAVAGQLEAFNLGIDSISDEEAGGDIEPGQS